MRFGTSSPTTIAKYVTNATTSPVANHMAAFSDAPQDSKRAASGGASVASPTMPERSAIEVIPICTVERNRVGSEPSSIARRAEESPASERGCRRARRALTSAISDMAKNPFNTISTTSNSGSMATLPGIRDGLHVSGRPASAA